MAGAFTFEAMPVMAFNPANGVITGVLWQENDVDGRLTADEELLSGVRVHLFHGNCTDSAKTLVATVMTDAEGRYHFSKLDAGDDYCVQVDRAAVSSDLLEVTGVSGLMHDVSPTLAGVEAAARTTSDQNFRFVPLFAAHRVELTLHNCEQTAWLDAVVEQHGATIARRNQNACLFLITVTPEAQAALLAELEVEPRVAHAARDARVRGEFIPNDPDYNDSSKVFAPQQINAEAAWDHAIGDPNIVLAVADTGIDFGHEEFQGRLLPGYDYVNEDDDPSDDHGHGSHVAGIAAAAINNGVGMAGIAGDATILPLKVLDEDNLGWWSDVAQAIIDATDQGATVINLSITGSSPSAAVKSAVDYATEHDMLVVAATGNDGTSELRYPAAYENVLGVGATDYNGERWQLSNTGPNVDLMAPGQFIYSVAAGGGYQYQTGTSMAAPHVAGAAILLRTIDPTLSITVTRTALESTAQDMGDPGVDDLHGHGLIDLGAAAAAVLPTATVSSGDCNADSGINAGDISALALEIFDGDGADAAAAAGGSFPGDPAGCDANQDAVINAGDLSCTTLMIFNPGHTCDAAVAARQADSPAPVLTMPTQLLLEPAGSLAVPINLEHDGGEINSLAFSIDYDEALFTFDPTDGDADFIPDTITIDTQPGVQVSVTFDPNETGSELDITMLTYLPTSVMTGPLLTITLQAQVAEMPADVSINFAADPAPSFGAVNGAAVAGTSSNSSTVISAPELIQTSQRVFLPLVTR